MNIKDELYRRLIIRALGFGKNLPAADISIAIEKSLPLTNRMLEDMVKDGILLETDQAISTGGRRAATYCIAPETVSVLSIAMDQFITKISMLDLSDTRIRNLRRYELPLIKNDDALEQFVSIVRNYISDSGTESKNLIGIGIGMPGFVDAGKGINHTYLLVPGSKPTRLTSFLEEELGLPVFIDNDSSTIALTEHMLGPAAKKTNSLVINFGWGVGLGMILDGKWYRGSTGFAGEFSHIPLFNNNRLCSCGKSGCLETGASMLTIIQDFRSALAAGRVSCIEELPDELEDASAMIIDATVAGDQLAVELFTQVAYDIGRGIAILIHILNPEQIIISGRGAAVGSIVLAPIQQAINKFCIPRLASYTEIVMSELTRDSEVYGAAALVTENMIKKAGQLLRKTSEIESH